MSTTFLIGWLVVIAAISTLLFRLSFKQNQLLSRRYLLGFALNMGLAWLWVLLLLHADLWHAVNLFQQGIACLVVLFILDVVLSVLLMWPFKNRKWRP